MNLINFGLINTIFMGFILGSVYFVSLWVTVRTLPSNSRFFSIIIGSLIVRITITVICLYMIMDGQWQKILLALLGFIVARNILINYWQPQRELNE